MSTDSLATRLHLAIDALEQSGRTAPLRAIAALVRGYKAEDQDVEPETVRAVSEEWRNIPELELPDDHVIHIPGGDLSMFNDRADLPLPAIGTRVRIPVVFPRVAKVMSHENGGAWVEMPGDSKLLWVAASDLEAEG